MIKYIQVKPNSEPPNISTLKPFRAVVISEENVSSTWQVKISDWLINSGCLYMLAWGVSCSAWDDSVDLSNLKKFNFEDIPEEELAVTTWHENESIKDVFWCAKNNAYHPVANIRNTLLIHVSNSNNEQELLNEYTST